MTLRFAALVRVSTERQEKEGESLNTQRKNCERFAKANGGEVVRWYGGQEHATPGYEKKEINRVIEDVKLDRFDAHALLVDNADRWSRDNGKSTEGIEVFKAFGIRFFVATTEYDLFNPTQRLWLGMSAQIGEFLAANQSLKSLENRIERAKRGWAACGKRPFGRIFDRTNKQWSVDEDKKRMVLDCAKRYLAGEELPRLADEYGISHSNLHKVLTQRCGPMWEQTFDCERFKIREVVPTPVPPLLSNEMIEAIRNQAQANRTYQRGQLKYKYLFSRMTFCSHCGYAMFGQTNHGVNRYYRHPHQKRVKQCSCNPWVNADELEAAVCRDLFNLFGNAAAVEEAVEAATPNIEMVRQYQHQRQRTEAEVAKVGQGRDRIIRLISKGTISEEEGATELEHLRAKVSSLQEELVRLDAQLANVPTSEAVRELAKKVTSTFKRTNAKLWSKKWELNSNVDAMTWEQRRALAEMVFSGKTPDGKRLGVYIERVDTSGSSGDTTFWATW